LRVVFDTNIVISALIFGRRLSWLRAAWARGAVTPVVCRETIAELLRVMAYPKFRLEAADREALLEDYLPFAEVAKLPAEMPLLAETCRDKDDLVFVALALGAKADALVSGDADLIVLQDTISVPILSLGALQVRLGTGD
jgi:putative PIN family toxin of toxin-antitoxin system